MLMNRLFGVFACLTFLVECQGQSQKAEWQEIDPKIDFSNDSVFTYWWTLDSLGSNGFRYITQRDVVSYFTEKKKDKEKLPSRTGLYMIFGPPNEVKIIRNGEKY